MKECGPETIVLKPYAESTSLFYLPYCTLNTEIHYG